MYDCIDNHDGFDGWGKDVFRAEERLLGGCDLVVATSEHIAADLRSCHERVERIRNACAPDDFVAARLPGHESRANGTPGGIEGRPSSR